MSSQRSEQSDLVNETLSSFFPSSRQAWPWVRRHRALQAHFFIWLDIAANEDKIGQWESCCETRCDQRKAQTSHKGFAVRFILRTWSPLGAVLEEQEAPNWWEPLDMGLSNVSELLAPAQHRTALPLACSHPSGRAVGEPGDCHRGAAAWGSGQWGGFQPVHKQRDGQAVGEVETGINCQSWAQHACMNAQTWMTSTTTLQNLWSEKEETFLHHFSMHFNVFIIIWQFSYSLPLKSFALHSLQRAGT